MLGGLISAFAPALPFLGAGLNYLGGREQRSADVANRDVQHAFQERMSNSAVSRHATDMANAGLNRILAAGGSASSPSGSTFAAKSLTEGAVSSAVALRRMQKEIEQADANIDLTKAQTTRVKHGAASGAIGTDATSGIVGLIKMIYRGASSLPAVKREKGRWKQKYKGFKDWNKK